MPFKPGQSGNPAGSQASKPFADALKRALARAAVEKNYADINKLAETLIIKASEGDIAALREIADRTDGRPSQAVEIDTGDNLTEMLLGIKRSGRAGSDNPPVA